MAVAKTATQENDLFGKRQITATVTEGIKYAGSKLKLLPYILDLAAEVAATSVFDAFAGTTRVSQAFAQNGYAVAAADISVWSETFAKCYLLGKQPTKYHKLIAHLNAVAPVDGWFTEHYGGDKQATSKQKKPWQYHNTRKLDGIRQEIERLGLNEIDKAVALTSLILALDRVDSTLGHYSSYLKDWSDRSANELHLLVPQIVPNPQGVKHQVLRGDVFQALRQVNTELAYLDPPYGSNNEKMPPSRVRYAAYYHLWTTIILNDEPAVFGAAKCRIDSRDTVAGSVFEEFRTNQAGRYIAVTAIEQLLQQIQANYVILSYSSGGRATATELMQAIHSVGEILTIKEVDYQKNVMAGMRWTDKWIPSTATKNIEYLFLLAKN